MSRRTRTLPSFGLLLFLVGPPLFAQEVLYTIPGVSTGDDFGYSLAAVDDRDGDGGQDFLVGWPGWSGGPGSLTGWVDARSGADGSVIQGFPGGAAGDLFGTAVAGLGDVNGDGVGDWLVGAPQVGVRGAGWVSAATGPGYAVVLSGQTGLVLRAHTGASIGDAFGFSVAGGHDVDLDGVGDYVVGAPVEQATYVYSGASGAQIRRIAGLNAEDGYSVALTASLDGDAAADVVVGAPGAFVNEGEALAFSGATGALLWTAHGDMNPGSELGWALAAPGDLNGDGVPDVIAGDREWGNSLGIQGRGRAICFSGANGIKFDGVVGTVNRAARGVSLAVLDDLDGDGVPEIAVGAPGIHEGGSFFYPPSDLWIVAGATRDVVSTIPVPAGNPDAFTWGLAAGELDGDGVADLLVGSPREDGLQPAAGRVTVYSTLSDPVVHCTSQVNSLGCVPSAHWTGTPSFASSTYRVRLRNTLNRKFGLLYWGPGAANIPLGDGTLCARSPQTRTLVQSSGGSPPPTQDCSGSFGFHFSTLYFNGHGLQPGDTIAAAYWSRDPAAPSGVHLSDAVFCTIVP